MACAYLLAQDDTPVPPRLERSHSAQQWAKMRAESAMEVVPEDADADDGLASYSSTPDQLGEDSPSQTVPAAVIPSARPPASPSVRSLEDALKTVLELHTSRRMKTPPAGKKSKQGVSIPSQRRYLYYWALVLENEAPPGLWVDPRDISLRQKVLLTRITLRMHEVSGLKKHLLKAARFVLQGTGLNGSGETGNVWASLARYDDELVGMLEKWERHTRNEGHMGWRREGSECLGDEHVDTIFQDDKWDKQKMVRTFARLGAVGNNAVVAAEEIGVSPRASGVWQVFLTHSTTGS